MLITFAVIFIINTIFALITVFREPRDIAATWAWILVLTLIPVLGFIIYSFAGRKLSQRRLFAYQGQDTTAMNDKIQDLMTAANQSFGQQAKSSHESEASLRQARSLVTLFQNLNQTSLATSNQVQILTSGQAFFEQLKADLRAAQKVLT